MENRNHIDDSIAGIGSNTEKNPGNLRRLAVTQIPVKNTSWGFCEKLEKSEIIIVVEAFGTVPNNLEKKQGEMESKRFKLSRLHS